MAERIEVRAYKYATKVVSLTTPSIDECLKIAMELTGLSLEEVGDGK